MLKRHNNTIAYIVCVACFILLAGTLYAQTFMCGQDLNGDGVIDATGETASCITTTQGQLCPISATACVKNMVCPLGSQYACNNSGSCSNGVCSALTNTVYSCPTGMTPDSTGTQCIASPACPSVYNPQSTTSEDFVSSTHTCEYNFDPCDSGWSLANGVCYYSAKGTPTGPGCSYATPQNCTYTCPPNTSLMWGGTCYGQMDATCSYGGWANAGWMACEVSPSCAVGSFDAGSNLCLASISSSVTTSYQCDLTGTSYASQADCALSCGQTSTCQPNYSCPLGSSYSCMDNSGSEQCSPNTCYDTSLSSGTSTSSANTSSYTNNGTIDPNTGACQGFIYIFNGKGSECRPSGYNTTYFSCCSDASGGTLDFLKHCYQSEADTVTAMDAKRCHYVGDYCLNYWKYIGCVQKSRTYCCFNSMLARIIQERGRPQLVKFAPDGNWGTAVSPNCAGFTPDDFQMIDFSKIDLTEYFSSINANISTQMQQNMNNSINNYYGNIKK
jgi:conjugal transfer mating pair stabilization protein TraN